MQSQSTYVPRYVYRGRVCSIEYAQTRLGRYPAQEFIQSLPPREQAQVLTLVARLADVGRIANPVYMSFISGTGFVALGTYQIRLLGVFAPGGVFVLAHGFKQKRYEILDQEIAQAKSVLQEHLDLHAEALVHYRRNVLSESPSARLPVNEPPQLPITSVDEEESPENLANELPAISPGREGASAYHRFAMRALESIFYPSLRKPVKEERVHEGRKRIDIVFNNGMTGFFRALTTLHNIQCPYIFVECKNYATDPENPEIDQLVGRFSDKRGRFGLLLCRRVEDRDLMLKRCKDVVASNNGYILVLDDVDLVALLNLRVHEDYDGIYDFLDDRFRQLVM